MHVQGVAEQSRAIMRNLAARRDVLLFPPPAGVSHHLRPRLGEKDVLARVAQSARTVCRSISPYGSMTASGDGPPTSTVCA